jgi:hypothetical protein
MILTPKNWGSFQHYKDRAPAWIKLHRGLLDDFEFARLPVASKALAPFLWLLASEYEGGQIDASIDELAFRLRMSPGDLSTALKPLIDGHFFDASEPLAECKRAAIPEKEIQDKIEEEGEKKHSTASPRASVKFEEFWKEYPRREGDNPRKTAEKKFSALVKTGVDPEVMIAGAKQATAAAKKQGIYATKYVPQAIKWLNDQRFLDCAAQAFTEQPEVLDWEKVISVYRSTGHWSRWAGPDPDSQACRAPAQLLEKYGIRADSLSSEHQAIQ